MFKLDPSPTFSAPVRVDVAGMEGEFTAVYRRLSQPSMDAMHDELSAGRIGDAEVLDLVFHQWGDDLRGEDGAPLDFNEHNLQRVFAVAGLRACVVRAFFRAYAPARVGN